MKSSQNVLYSGESCENGMAVQTLNRTSGSRMSLRKREKQAQSVVFYASVVTVYMLQKFSRTIFWTSEEGSN